MAIFGLIELLDVVIMSVCVGYIFSDLFSKFNFLRKPRDYVDIYHYGKHIVWSDVLFSIYLVGPAIILHELGHKVLALFFGLSAEFHAAYFWLGLGMMLKFAGFPFIFFVPAYVSISGGATVLQNTLIAFAGPGVNLILWLGALFLMKSKLIPHKYVPFAVLTSKINMMLFIFNMIPIPGFDGSKVFSGLFSMLF